MIGTVQTRRAPLGTGFWIFAVGQVVSGTGTGMELLALTWAVLGRDQLGVGTPLLSVILLALFGPSVALGQVAGRIVDRWSRERVLVATLALQAAAATTVGFALIAGHLSVPLLLGYALVLGLLQACEVPARQVFLMDLLGEDFKRGYSVYIVMSGVARMAGLALAGRLIVELGTGPVFVLNGLTFALVICAVLAAARSPARPVTHWPPAAAGPVTVPSSVAEIYLLVFVIGAIGNQFPVTNALMTLRVFDGDAAAYGDLGAAAAVGAILGAAAATRLPDSRALMLLAALSFGVFEVLAGTMRHYLGYAAVLLVVAASFSVFITAAVAQVRRRVAGDRLGRAMAWYNAALTGCVPVGTLVVGAIADHLGTRSSLILPGIAIAVAALVALSRIAVRPRYPMPGSGECDGVGDE